MKHAVVGVSLWLAAGAVAAAELVLPDASEWQVNGTAVTRSKPAPSLEVRLNLYPLGVGCEAGLKARANVNAAPYLPATFYTGTFEQPDEGEGDAYATVCADLPNGVLVANLLWKGELTTADAGSFRLMLEYLAQEASGNPPPAQPTVALFEPALTSVSLNTRTGVWNSVRERTNADTATLVQAWPKAAILMQLQRAAHAQRCTTVGFDTSTAKPAWAPDSFYAYGAHRDGAGFACFDGADGRLVLISVIENQLTPDDVQRIGAMVEAAAIAVDRAPKILIAPKAP
jgi:hypothetical protein